MRLAKPVVAAILAYGIVCLAIAPWVLSRPDMIFSGDATGYHGGAVHLVLKGMYTFDGVTPTITREPGMSLFLAGIYALFGIANAQAVFVVQALLYLVAVLTLTREWAHRTNRRQANITAVLLLLFPPMFSVIFTLNRELLAFSLLAFTMTAWLRMLRTPSVKMAVLTGVLFGTAVLAYAPFLLFPLFFIAASLLLKLRWKLIAITIACFALPLVPWAIRNESVAGRLCLTGCYRPTIQWYVRGERSEHLRGFEPFMCLWAEYVSRDWSNRSPYCSFNAVWHARWPNGFDESPASIPVGQEARQKVLRYFPYYLWDSAFEILELHLPFVHGWGRTYNVFAALGTLIIYIGMLFALPLWKKQWLAWLPLLAMMAYVTGVFILTDATPRYLMPIIFCYAAISAAGFERLLDRLYRKRL